ncbi:MAG: WYL domain-containing protein [Clostridiales bacterium]|nr:WYL domain-containing protein [Clostridiales bacterium]
MKILLAETDEAHPITVSTLIEKLAAYGIRAERKAIYDDMETLRQFGLDIVAEKAKAYGYFVASRDFQLPELKLLADSVQSAKFITEKKSLELIKKLQGLSSIHEAGKLRRQVYLLNRVKSMNESIYYNVDAIHEAIGDDRKINFRYFEYNVRKEQVFRRQGARYTVSPIVLTWSDEHYYLIAHSDDRSGFSHYRVDRMSGVRKLEEGRGDAVRGFDLAEYTKKVFGMFGGEEAEVRLRIHNSLAGAVIDRFGKEAAMAVDGETHFVLRAKVALSPIFYGWLFQFGDLCEVLSPQGLKDVLITYTEQFLAKLR